MAEACLLRYNCPPNKEFMKNLDVEWVAFLTWIHVGGRSTWVQRMLWVAARKEFFVTLQMIKNNLRDPLVAVILCKVVADRIGLALTDIPRIPLSFVTDIMLADSK
jgi:hypothetical protein